ncbi:major facilitator superfamily transporter [Beauveria bassiana ARSEF 2860]|uniref:Major facilitator superfamily transporter n=1 Tax=Beauveria bassiana (strain ARSEF 2860) TaxID=655819 RepID=J5JJ16_BEAB2|nr:major facilitator superfamily transporter [Beauveria bassiana ARSEF 2860]EJP63321.1 major facilitator superfamily transporter [Beauveria bassiana ARSEF 2860]
MSLAQHLTVEDEFECDLPDENPNHAQGSWRRMSFDAFAPVRPHLDIAADTPNPEAAYKASTLRRIVQVALAVSFCFLASGIVFGFASIKPILVYEGVYSEFCSNGAGTGTEGGKSDGGGSRGQPCAEQEIRLNLLFIVASVTTNTSSLFAGYTLDRFGRRWCATVAAGFLAVGALMMASHGNMLYKKLDGYLLGNFFLSLGGTFLFLPSFQLSNAFPKHAGLVVALITCAFDASSAVFFLYRLAWEASHQRIRIAHFFLAYLCAVPPAIIAAEWTVMPRQRYHTLPELERKMAKARSDATDVHASDDDVSDTQSLLRVRSHRAEHRRDKLQRIEDITGGIGERVDRRLQQAALQQSDGVWGLLHGRPVAAQMRTPVFALLLCVTAFQMLRMNLFIATIGSQYRYMLGSAGETAIITDLFNAALPIGGVAATPLIALLLNSCSVATVLTVMTGYTASKIFGFATFGRVYGTVICASGVFNLVQPAVESWLSVQLQGNPLPLNIGLGVVGTVLAALFTGLTHKFV